MGRFVVAILVAIVLFFVLKLALKVAVSVIAGLGSVVILVAVLFVAYTIIHEDKESV